MYIVALFPLYIVLPFIVNVVISVFSNFLSLNVQSMFTSKGTTIMYDFVLNSIIIISFFLLKNEISNDYKKSVNFIKDHWLSLVTFFAIIKLLLLLSEWIIKYFNGNLNLINTENQRQVIDWIKSEGSVVMTVIIFLSITVIGPIFEEIIFRHIIIRELGALFNYKFMAIVSIILFACVHVMSAKYIYEMIIYLILSLPLVYFYFKSNFNIFIPILFHVLVNLTSYIYIIIWY